MWPRALPPCHSTIPVNHDHGADLTAGSAVRASKSRRLAGASLRGLAHGQLSTLLHCAGGVKGAIGRAENVHHLPFFFTMTEVRIPFAVISLPLGSCAPGTS